MNLLRKTLKKYASWLLVILLTDLFAVLLIWLVDTQAFYALTGVIILWSLLLFFFVSIVLMIKERRKQKRFQDFLFNPDLINEEKLLRTVGQQEREQIQLLASVLRNERTQQEKLTEELRDYEEYVEKWAHEAKMPLSLLTMVLDNRSDEISSHVRVKLEYVCSLLQEDITQMLYYARLKSSTKDYLLEEIQLLSVLTEVLEDYAPILQEKQFVIHNLVKAETVFTDRRGLQFMLGQIICNVLKYSSEKPELTFSVTNTDSACILTVTDNGCGVKDYDLPFIFQKGFTGESGTQRKKATGMGLFLTKKMADDLHLKLEVESEYERYFKISIYFPYIKQIQ